MSNLITLDIYKQAKALTGTKQDDVLNFLITSVSQLVKSYCGRTFNDYAFDPKEEYHSFEFPTSKLILDEFPVIEVGEVYTRTSPTESYVLTTDWVLNRNTDSLHTTVGTWPLGIESVKVIYLSGYEILPSDLTLAVIDLITYYLKEEYRHSKSLQGATMNFAPTSSLRGNCDFPDHIKRVLDLYRQV